MIKISLPITKKQFDDSVIKFIHRYNRLPFLHGDSVEIEMKDDSGDMVTKPYRANKYMIEYYKDQENMTKELIDNKILPHKLISDIVRVDENKIKKILKREIDRIDLSARRRIEIFFNKDYFPKMGLYSAKCVSCKKKKCKQPYFLEVIACKNYKSARAKKNN